MKTNLILLAILAIVMACSQTTDPKSSDSGDSKAKTTMSDNKKGIGEIKTVSLNNPLNQDMVARGQAIYDMKCAACHKLKGSRVVGPSWAGLTTKREPEWIMNMITNVEVMLEKDPVAQKLLEECLVRMPNQNISVGDARDILEFMYQNDIDNAE